MHLLPLVLPSFSAMQTCDYVLQVCSAGKADYFLQMKQSCAHHHHKEEEEVFRFSNTQVSSFAVTSLDRVIVNLGMAVVFLLGSFLRQNYRRFGD